jgi:ABC-type Fe3+/spermidine/putrescine transport system ATPase subunit
VSVRLPTGQALQAARRGDVRRDQAVTVAVRPERLRLGPTPPTGDQVGWNCVAGQVRRTTYLGNATRFEVVLPDGTRLDVDQPHAEPALPPTVDTCYLYWSPANTLLLAE